MEELSERILNPTDGLVVNLVNVLWSSKGAHFTDDSQEESLIFYGVAAHVDKLVGELREIRFRSLSHIGEMIMELVSFLMVVSVERFKLSVRTFYIIYLIPPTGFGLRNQMWIHLGHDYLSDSW